MRAAWMFMLSNGWRWAFSVLIDMMIESSKRSLLIA